MCGCLNSKEWKIYGISLCAGIAWKDLGFRSFLTVSLSRRSGSREWRTVVLGRTCRLKNFAVMDSLLSCSASVPAKISATLKSVLGHIMRKARFCTDSSISSFVRLSVCLSVVCRLSVVWNVRAPYSGDWNFRQCFYAVWHLGHLWPFDKNFTEILPGEPLRRGVKPKNGRKM